MNAFLELPFEITSQIFVYCLPKEDDALPSRNEAPLLIASVCRNWRDIALATPELWNTIHLRLQPHTILKASPLLEFWAPRAGNLPRSMSLHYNNVHRHSYGHELEDLASLLVRFASHWGALELRVPFAFLLRLDVSTASFVSLRKLALGCPASFNEGRQLAAFAESSQLRELHMLSGTPIATALLPWERLTKLRLDTASRKECLKLLALTPNLLDFSFTLWSSDPMPLAPPANITLQHLDSFRATLSQTRWSPLLALLTLPALRNLEVDIHGISEIRRITTFIARSSCFLRRLSVMFGERWTTAYFQELFSSLDSLEELEIGKVDEAIFGGLTLLKTQPLLPNLRSMAIEHTSPGASPDPQLIADFLESRWKVPSGSSLPVQLKSFRLHSPLTSAPEYDAAGMRRLRRLRKKGMVIHISSSRYWFSSYSY